MVLHGCTDIYNASTNTTEIINKDSIDKVIRKMAEKSLRTLCLAYKKISTHENIEKKEEWKKKDIKKREGYDKKAKPEIDTNRGPRLSSFLPTNSNSKVKRKQKKTMKN